MNFWAEKAEHSLVMVVYPRGMLVYHKRNIFIEWKVKMVAIATLESAMSMKCRVKQV